MKINVIIPCGGSSTRTQTAKNKILLNIHDVPVITRTVTPFAAHKDVTRIIIPANPKDTQEIADDLKGIETLGHAQLILVKGGKNRTESVKNALAQTEKDCDIIIIHDGARPFIKYDTIVRCIDSAVNSNSGICAYLPTDTIGFLQGNQINNIPDRKSMICIQTPQAFKSQLIKLAYSKIEPNEEFTDDSSVYVKYIDNANFIIGDKDNIKITFKEDLNPIKNVLIGYGADTHRLVEGRPLIIGNVNIPHEKGLLAHSDGDVLLHAIMDALLAAAGLRDIGVQFPDSDEQYDNIDSLILLRAVRDLLKAQKVSIESISAVIMAQRPKLMRFIPQMENRIARCLNINKKQINITVTTTEGLGYEGREEGISTRAVAVVKEKF